MYEIQYADVTRLQKGIEQIPKESEKIVDEYLHSKGTRLIEKTVQKYIQPSNRDKSSYRTGPTISSTATNPFTATYERMGVIIRAKGGAANSGPHSFGYLVFPDEGRGIHNPVQQDFANKGMTEAHPELVEDLENAIYEAIERLLG